MNKTRANYRTIALLLTGASCLFSADAPKTLSPDFAKAGLKALIILKNGDRSLNRDDYRRYRDTLDTAEVAAATEDEKTTLAAIRRYQERRQNDGLHLTEHRLAVIQTGVDILSPIPEDPQTAKDLVATDACADGLEKVLRSRVFAPVPECYQPREEAKAEPQQAPARRPHVSEHSEDTKP
jgi:hypothetical protein